jgi:predicted enzyme related to lactoylglutathione lyase
MKKRVTGLGGVFFKSTNPAALKQWYKEHLEIDSGEHGAMFNWRHHDDPAKEGNTVWSVFPDDTAYFKPGTREFMFNYRVEDLEELLKVLKKEGVEIVGEIEEYPYGKFGWIMDPDGNKIELWEPLNEKTL